ncbi:integrase/recombinase XerD [Paraburkholderia bannensis]|uniref:Integrase/recombinase XerD n=1 Tax=Paraburkholderia bannensis TaxID=765414 RepID=A0A7W9TUD3_9BURK|nr:MULTISPECIES: site-specific integrase [Paraburkholderia]MBB3256229.1 integrase/recombinase XerD [Paraburkholderia sp. WP4_3_2]MBB6101229.1 integrase/recombinase XerD [Paraburkholderia bannensis]
MTESEFRRVVNAAKKEAHAKRNIALLYCSFGLGLRAKEMAALRIRHVLSVDGELPDEINLDGSMTKGNKQRHAYLTNPKVADAIRDYLDERRIIDGIAFNHDAPLFRSQKGGQFTPNTLQQLFQRMYSKARLQGASSHSGRRTFATTLIEKGVDIKAVSTLMGHASIAMTARYVEDNPVRLKQISADAL